MATVARVAGKVGVIGRLTPIQWLFVIITFAHLLLFIKYNSTVERSVLTNLAITLDWKIKTGLPIALLITLAPDTRKVLDRLLSQATVNKVGLLLIAMSVGFQIGSVPGQAWSTLAFSFALMLLLYNNLLAKHRMSNTVALVLSFMIAWLGWVAFEVVFHTGQWLIHPHFYGYDWRAYYKLMLQMAVWTTAPIIYIRWAIAGAGKDETEPRLRLGNPKLFLILIGIAAVATTIWFKTGMLVPIPLDHNGVPCPVEIHYLTTEHLEFSISRLSQISIMLAPAMLFYERRRK